MTTAIRVTAATAAHAKQIVALGERLQRDASPCSFWGVEEATVQRWLADPTCAVYVVQRGTSVVGLGKLQRGTAFQQHLAEVSVAVCPQHRRQGIAQALLGSLEHRARQGGVELLKALIWTENHASRRLFEAAGYVHRATLYAEFKSAQFGSIDDCVYYLAV